MNQPYEHSPLIKITGEEPSLEALIRNYHVLSHTYLEGIREDCGVAENQRLQLHCDSLPDKHQRVLPITLVSAVSRQAEIVITGADGREISYALTEDERMRHTQDPEENLRIAATIKNVLFDVTRRLSRGEVSR